MKLTYDEAKHSTQAYFPDDTVAPDVFLGKYALRDNENTILESDPDDMFKNRIAPELARIEARYPNPLSSEQIYSYMCKRPGRLGMGPIVPQGSPLSGIGNPYKIQSISNCFVVASPEDSYAGIFYTDQQEAQIMKRRGGVGFDISSIRPKGMPTANAAGTTDGIAVFMDRYSNTCREVAQGGRRGALMLTIQCFEGSTNVLTQDGWQRIDNVVDTQYSGKVWTHEGWKEIEAYQKFEDSELYEIETENGKTIKVTSDHKFVVKNIDTGEEYLKEIKYVDVEKEELVFYDTTLSEG